MVVNLRTIAAEYLKTPLGEPVKGKNKTTTKLWLEKFYQKTTNLPEPFPLELAERLEKYLDRLEEHLVDLSSFFVSPVTRSTFEQFGSSSKRSLHPSAS
ncbi:hypothetical protein NC651_020303 [Populus alba x Populus x berolinensis]|nr:hypothetical protein NC651_020303 [Populus alba x Populus x berolinensis]